MYILYLFFASYLWFPLFFKKICALFWEIFLKVSIQCPVMMTLSSIALLIFLKFDIEIKKASNSMGKNDQQLLTWILEQDKTFQKTNSKTIGEC